MTTENAEQQRWTGRQTLAAVVVAVVIGGLGGAAVYAATEGSAHEMGPMHGPPPPGPGPNRPVSAPTPAAPNLALHSEYVIRDGNGGFAVEATRTGAMVTLNRIAEGPPAAN